MSDYLTDINLIIDFIFSSFIGIWTLYTTSFILLSVLTIWIVRQVLKLFDLF